MTIKTNNPGNLRRTTDKWNGLSAEQPDPNFFTFDAPKWGIRSIERVLITKQNAEDTNRTTIRKLITSYAPPSENNTEQYIKNVSDWSGIGAEEDINIEDYSVASKIIPAIIRQENGVQPYNKDTIDEALRLAGVSPPSKSLVKSPIAIIGTVSAIAGSAQPILEQVSYTASTLSPFLSTLSSAAPYLIGLVILLGGLWLIIHEYKKSKI